MRIVIETDGSSAGTKISFNGEDVTRSLKEFRVTIQTGHKVKAQMVREFDPKDGPQPISYFGDDFKKIDEIRPEKKEN